MTFHFNTYSTALNVMNMYSILSYIFTINQHIAIKSNSKVFQDRMCLNFSNICANLSIALYLTLISESTGRAIALSSFMLSIIIFTFFLQTALCLEIFEFLYDK